MIPSDIDDRCVAKGLLRPFNPLDADMNIAGQDDGVNFRVGNRKRGKLHMQITQNQYPHTCVLYI